jgi:hypothetical protein
MSPVEHRYTPPQSAGAELPPDVASYLDGTNLLAKTQAMRLSTVNPSGWPHATLLSAGDMLATAPNTVRFVVFLDSGTTQNLEKDPRITLTLALDGGMCEVLMHARRLTQTSAEVPLAFFEGETESVRWHKAPYADIPEGITFALHDPAAVLPRWERQIAALRAV